MKQRPQLTVLITAIVALLFLFPRAAQAQEAGRVIVYADVTLRFWLGAVGQAFSNRTRIVVVTTYLPTFAFWKQVAAVKPPDVIVLNAGEGEEQITADNNYGRLERPSSPLPQFYGLVVRNDPSAESFARFVFSAQARRILEGKDPAAFAHLSAEQIAAANAAFEQALAQQRAAPAVTPAPLPSPSVFDQRSPRNLNGLHFSPGDSKLIPVRSEQRGDENFHWIHYQVMYLNGVFEEDDIPWPFHYPRDSDPFARHVGPIPVQAPPPDFKPTRPLKPFLQHFFGGPNVYY